MNMVLEGGLKVNIHILDLEVMWFQHDPLVGIGIFYLTIRFQMLYRCRVVKQLTVVQQRTLIVNRYTV